MFNFPVNKPTIFALLLLICMAVLVNLLTINTPFFTDDPGLYGSIAKQLIYHHDFFQLYSYGRDWLDKPHLPFWLILLSFKLFGIHTWSYKLPALLCFLLSLLYTWLFTKKYYSQITALIAVLIVSTSLHIIMSNVDVRAEPYLMAFIIGAIYHIANLEERFGLTDLLFAAVLTAFAIMTKGIFVIIPMYGALAGQLLFQKKLTAAFRVKWLALLALTILFTAPELYALYIQFDLHPEKIVFGRQHVSGIKWFLWDSQFGRFANTGPITRPHGSVFFFIHTLLWAFAPWCFIFYYAVFKQIKSIFSKGNQPEYYALSGGLILLVLFSVSGFQLPFYTNIIFPLFAVVTADFCTRELLSKAERTFASAAMIVYSVALTVVMIVLLCFLNSPNSIYYLIISCSIAGVIALTLQKVRAPKHIKIFMQTCSIALIVNANVGAALYPLLTANKGQIKAAYFVNQSLAGNTPVYSLRDQNNIFQFYCNRPVKLIQLDELARVRVEPNAFYYADQDAINFLTQHHLAFNIINKWVDYPQENILPAFVNYKTRSTTLQQVYIIQLN